MKKIILRVALAAVLLLVAAVAVAYFSLNSLVKRGVETVGPQIAGVPVQLASANILPFSGSGELNKLFVGNPEAYKSPSAIAIGHVKVTLKVSSVFSDTVIVEELLLDAPQITIEGGITKNNLTAILDNLEASLASEEAQPVEKAEERKFIVRDLTIRGGSIKVAFGILGGKGVTVPLSDLHLQNLGANEGGITAAELGVEIMKPLLVNVTKAVSEVISGAGKTIEDATKGVKDLFRR